MAFDAGPPRTPPVAPFKREPIDWLDVITRTIGVGLLAALYLMWLGHQFSGVIQALGFN